VALSTGWGIPRVLLSIVKPVLFGLFLLEEIGWQGMSQNSYAKATKVT
jgi:hypothetical protein